MKYQSILIRVLYAALAIFCGFASYGIYVEHGPWWSVVANSFVCQLFAANAIGHRLVLEKKK